MKPDEGEILTGLSSDCCCARVCLDYMSGSDPSPPPAGHCVNYTTESQLHSKSSCFHFTSSTFSPRSLSFSDINDLFHIFTSTLVL